MLIISFVIIIVSVLLDQLTKYLAVEHLVMGESHAFIPGLIEFNRVPPNEGIAWGLLKGQRWLFVPVSCIAIVLVIVALVYYRKKFSPLLSVAMAMIAGGGIGNQIDRIVNGKVVDFLNFQFIDFPVFNVADCFVSVGCVLAIISVIFIDKWILFDDKDKKKVSGEKNDK
ncbi:MAG: signal peptidase II [Ruminococcaceae bacterium]|nr:signal peptidase II [Oscillospiraceae bacterium]